MIKEILKKWQRDTTTWSRRSYIVKISLKFKMDIFKNINELTKLLNIPLTSSCGNFDPDRAKKAEWSCNWTIFVFKRPHDAVLISVFKSE